MKGKTISKKINAIPDCRLVLKSLMLNLPGHVYWKDKNGIYLGCNDRQAQSLGLSFGEEVVGKTDFDLPWQEDLARHFWENDAQVLVSGKSKSFEELAIVNGKEAIVWSLKVPLKTSTNEIVGILGISIDITQQKKFEEQLIHAKEAQETAFKTKMRFLANIKHDIRTPMAGIRGCIQVINDYLDHGHIEKAKEYLGDLDTSSQALLALLNNVLEKLQTSSQLAVKKNCFNLQTILLQVLELNEARAKQKGLKLNLQHDSKISYLVGDGERIQRVVLELVSNALNFTKNGEVKVITELTKACGDHIIIKIIIEDTGCGISVEKQQSIFTSLAYLEPSYQGSSLGTGLGLLLIKQLVDDLDGEIYLESEEEKGSRFTCVLPFKLALLNTEADSHKISIKTKNEPLKVVAVEDLAEPIHVLLVEDDKIVSKVVQMLLTKLGCKVDLAFDGDCALSMLNEQLYNLVFLDIGLPDKNGNEVAAEIRGNKKCCNQMTPIIAVTAHVDSESKKESFAAGINAVLLKPLSEDDISYVLKIFQYAKL